MMNRLQKLTITTLLVCACEEEVVILEPAPATTPTPLVVDKPETKAPPKLQPVVDNNANYSPWAYSGGEDKMGRLTGLAKSTSLYPFDLAFPYQGEQNATLVLRKNHHGKDVMLQIERGQMPCTGGCTVSVQFDDKKPKTWYATRPSDNDSTFLFFRRSKWFWKAMKKAKFVKIEATLYQEGNRIFSFSVRNFDPKKMK